jgi:hypothetical protein
MFSGAPGVALEYDGDDGGQRTGRRGPGYYDPTTTVGGFPVGEGTPLLSIGAVYIVLKSFANGGSSLTGLEAISNGVSTFRPPQGLNARRTLVIMSTLLGTLVAGVSWLAHETHAVTYESGSPTVI